MNRKTTFAVAAIFSLMCASSLSAQAQKTDTKMDTKMHAPKAKQARKARLVPQVPPARKAIPAPRVKQALKVRPAM